MPWTSSQIVQILTNTANKYGVPPQLAIAIADQESGLDPYAIGDGGTSFGLGQLHEGGELGNLSQSQAFDPQTNADVFVGHLAQVYHANPGLDPGVIAATAQGPADKAGYASSIDQKLHSLFSGGSINIPDQSYPTITTASSVSSTSTQSPSGPPPDFTTGTLDALNHALSPQLGLGAWLPQAWAGDIRSVLVMLIARVALVIFFLVIAAVGVMMLTNASQLAGSGGLFTLLKFRKQAGLREQELGVKQQAETRRQGMLRQRVYESQTARAREARMAGADIT